MSTIVRVEKKTNYTIIDNTALRDSRLSWKAKGLMAYMLSMPDDWTFYMDELQKHATDGKSSFRSGFNELKKLGYVERKRIQREDGTFFWETIVHERPHTDFPQVDYPSMEKPQVEKPSMDNRPLLSTNKPSTDKQNTNRPSTDDNKQTSLSSPGFKKAIELYENLIPGGVTSIVGDKIDDDLNTYGIELMEKAFEVAALRNKRFYGYIRGILKNWHHEGVRTAKDLELKEKEKRSQNAPDQEEKNLYEGYDFGF